MYAAIEDINISNHSAAQKNLVVIKKGSRSVIKQCKNRRQILSELESTKKREEKELQDEIGQLGISIQETGCQVRGKKVSHARGIGRREQKPCGGTKRHAEAHESLESRETGVAAATWATVVVGVVMPLTLAATVPTLMYLKGLVKDAQNNVDSAELKVQDIKIFHVT